MWKKAIIILLIIVILGGGFLFFKNRNSSQTTMADVTLVKISEAKPESITTSVSADGTVKADEEEDIKAGINGIVKEVDVDKGDFIARGDNILKIDEKPFLNSLEKADLNLDEAKRNYQSMLDTYNKQDHLDKLKLEEAERNLEIAILSLEKERITMKNNRIEAQNKLDEAEDAFNKAKDKLEDDQILYENGAIPLKTLEESEDSNKKAEENYHRVKEELNILIEETIPNSLDLAQLKVDNARNSLERLKASIAQDRITENDLELARIKIKRVENEIEHIKEDLEKVDICSPMEGTIIDLSVKNGDKITEGMTVGKVGNLNQLIIEAMVDEVNINEVKVNQQVKVTSDSFEGELEGKVVSIDPVGTKVGNINKFKTKITLKDTEGLLRPGMFVNTEITTNYHDSVIAVSPVAVMGGDDKYVYISKNGIVEKRPVQVGLKNLSKVEITGVEAGEDIIIGPFTVLNQLEPGVSVADIDRDLQ